MTGMQTQDIYSTDLAGIIVGETAISDVQGERGVLSYRGHMIESIAHKPFLQVAWLLVFGEWPTPHEEHQLAEFTVLHRRLNAVELGVLQALPRELHPMLMLQSVIPTLAVPENGQDFYGCCPRLRNRGKATGTRRCLVSTAPRREYCSVLR